MKPLRCLVLGSRGSGKTTVACRLADPDKPLGVNGEFNHECPDGDIYPRPLVRVQVEGDPTYRLHISEPVCRRESANLGPSWFRGQDLLIIVYDVADQNSQDVVPELIEYCVSLWSPKRALDHETAHSSDGLHIVVLGNKTDLDSSCSSTEMSNTILKAFVNVESSISNKYRITFGHHRVASKFATSEECRELAQRIVNEHHQMRHRSLGVTIDPLLVADSTEPGVRFTKWPRDKPQKKHHGSGCICI